MLNKNGGGWGVKLTPPPAQNMVKGKNFLLNFFLRQSEFWLSEIKSLTKGFFFPNGTALMALPLKKKLFCGFPFAAYIGNVDK